MYSFQDIGQRGQQQEHSRNRFGTAQKELRQIQMEGTYPRLIGPPVVRILSQYHPYNIIKQIIANDIRLHCTTLPQPNLT